MSEQKYRHYAVETICKKCKCKFSFLSACSVRQYCNDCKPKLKGRYGYKKKIEWQMRQPIKIKTRAKQILRFRTVVLREKKRFFNRMGYTKEELINHLQKQFKDGMYLENYGIVWNIDHIIPMTHFNIKKKYDDEYKKAWSLNNLQPLYLRENSKKGNRV